MSSDSGPRLPGRRNNGLGAGSFLSVGDVDPRVGEHLLDVLYLNGIAAYLQPTVDHDSFTRAVSLPGQPTDRLWVDRGRFDDARHLVTTEVEEAGHTPAPPTASSPVEDDAAWEQIVATFDTDDSPAVAPWPVNEDDDDDKKTDAAPAAKPAATARPTRLADEVVEQGDSPAVPEGDDEEEGYVPPPPPPLPRMSKHTMVALGIIVFGVVMLFAWRVLDISARQGTTLGFLALIGGIGYLFWNLRDGPPAEDRPDDGAVV